MSAIPPLNVSHLPRSVVLGLTQPDGRTQPSFTDYLSSLVLTCGISFGSIVLAFCAVERRVRSGRGGAAALGARMLIRSRRQAAMV